MNKMHNLSIYLKVMLAINANGFLYFLGKLPILNRLISPTLYKNLHLKLVFSFFGTLFDFLKAALGKSILVLVLIRYLPLLLYGQNWQDSPDLGLQVTLFLILMCVLPAFQQSAIFQTSKEDFIFLNHFSLNPDEYYRVKTGTGLVRQVVSLFPILLFTFHDFFTAFMLVSAKVAFVMMGNILFLKQYKDRRKLIDVKFRMLFLLITVALTYLGLYFDRIPGFYPSHLLAISISMVSLVITAAAWHYVTGYRNFKEVAVQFANKDVLTLKVSVTSTLNEGDTGLKSIDWSANKQFWEKNKAKEPAKYIEQALNSRFNKPIWSFSRQTLIMNLLASTVIGLLVRTHVIKLDATNLLSYSPILISLVISMTYGVPYLQLCFRNLDLPLLYHHLYSKKRIIQSMGRRASFLCRVGLIHLSSFAASLVLFLQIAGLHLSPNIILDLVIVYSLIFLIYELFHFLTYYALQPYSSELSVKSPVFTALSIIESLFSVYFLFARANVLSLTQPLIIIAAALILCCMLLPNWVDKTFKLKY
jgi:fumarate reductase subunit C